MIDGLSTNYKEAGDEEPIVYINLYWVTNNAKLCTVADISLLLMMGSS